MLSSASFHWLCPICPTYLVLCCVLCCRNYPGPHPFLKTLKAVLLLQALALKQGGAGAMRLEWEIDDAVWLESGGDDFTRAGIHLLVGVSCLCFFRISKHQS